MSIPRATRPGQRLPPGATPAGDGVNFSIFSRDATAVSLLLYDGPDRDEPFQIIRLDRETHCTFFFWHVFVEGLEPGIYYTWRVDGPVGDAANGFRFDGERQLLDPWAKEVSDVGWDRAIASGPAAAGAFMRAIVPAGAYAWSGDRPLNHAMEDAVIYELHLGGFTRHPSSGVADPGTFAALAEKSEYLRALGVTDVQLMPVMAFDEQDVPPGTAALGLRNYWGYSTHSYFAPHPGYSRRRDGPGQREEFRDMVRTLHAAGLGVILDVVFNHTAEGGSDGPVLNFKGLGNDIFYHLEPEDRRLYRDFTGCGNTVNCNHPLVANFIDNCLEYWVREMHVDGFRFDLASVLARGEDGAPMYHAPVLWNIEFSPVLARSKLIAEAWDAGGLYQVGDFPGYRWAELNGRYRDVLRRVLRGERGLVGELATRLTGSSDLYAASGRLPVNSVNYVTCHDGFTLWDLVSYERKHNLDNGEENRDGLDENLSSNYGTEGPSDDPVLDRLRRQQARNVMALLLLSQGVPFLLAGDEVLRSQGGNNNAWCQDNPLGWFDWGLVEHNRPMLRFVREMIALRKRHRCLRRNRFLSGHEVPGTGMADVTWHGPRLGEPPWDDPDAQWLAYTLAPLDRGAPALHVMINMAAGPVSFEVPGVSSRHWRRAVDTGLPPPYDISPPGSQAEVRTAAYRLEGRSVVVLEGWLNGM
jgi:glycogen operon protein